MRTISFTILFFAAAAPLQADPPLRKLHVLLAIGDADAALRDHVRVDQRRMEQLLKANVPSERCDLKVLAGKKLSSPAISAHFRAIKAGPEDTLLFFYAGHGVKDPSKGYAFVPQQLDAPPIFRSDVKEAMKQAGAGLVVILSDCCSTSHRLVGKPTSSASRSIDPAPSSAMHPTLEHLLFRHRGVIDVTGASDGESSWSDGTDGGIFTRALVKQLLRSPAELDTDGDKFVSWKEFFPTLKKGTEDTYRPWQAKMRSLGDAVDQPNQRPNALSLGERIPGEAPKPDSSGGPHSVICLVNESGEAVSYKYRFSARDPWQSVELAPGKRTEHSSPRGKTVEIARFEILFGGNKSPIELEADTWSGKGPPPRGAASHEYPIIPRKQEK